MLYFRMMRKSYDIKTTSQLSRDLSQTVSKCLTFVLDVLCRKGFTNNNTQYKYKATVVENSLFNIKEG